MLTTCNFRKTGVLDLRFGCYAFQALINLLPDWCYFSFLWCGDSEF